MSFQCQVRRRACFLAAETPGRGMLFSDWWSARLGNGGLPKREDWRTSRVEKVCLIQSGNERRLRCNFGLAGMSVLAVE